MKPPVEIIADVLRPGILGETLGAPAMVALDILEHLEAAGYSIRRSGQCQCEACQVTPHASSCAVHNAPALENGPCDCTHQDPASRWEGWPDPPPHS